MQIYYLSDLNGGATDIKHKISIDRSYGKKNHKSFTFPYLEM